MLTRGQWYPSAHWLRLRRVGDSLGGRGRFLGLSPFYIMSHLSAPERRVSPFNCCFSTCCKWEIRTWSRHMIHTQSSGLSFFPRSVSSSSSEMSNCNLDQNISVLQSPCNLMFSQYFCPTILFCNFHQFRTIAHYFSSKLCFTWCHYFTLSFSPLSSFGLYAMKQLEI